MMFTDLPLQLAMAGGHAYLVGQNPFTGDWGAARLQLDLAAAAGGQLLQAVRTDTALMLGTFSNAAEAVAACEADLQAGAPPPAAPTGDVVEATDDPDAALRAASTHREDLDAMVEQGLGRVPSFADAVQLHCDAHRAPVEVFYGGGLLGLACATCEEPVLRIAVAEEEATHG